MIFFNNKALRPLTARPRISLFNRLNDIAEPDANPPHQSQRRLQVANAGPGPALRGPQGRWPSARPRHVRSRLLRNQHQGTRVHVGTGWYWLAKRWIAVRGVGRILSRGEIVNFSGG